MVIRGIVAVFHFRLTNEDMDYGKRKNFAGIYPQKTRLRVGQSILDSYRLYYLWLEGANAYFQQWCALDSI